jgi:hypothetical protein
MSAASLLAGFFCATYLFTGADHVGRRISALGMPSMRLCFILMTALRDRKQDQSTYGRQILKVARYRGSWW